MTQYSVKQDAFLDCVLVMLRCGDARTLDEAIERAWEMAGETMDTAAKCEVHR